MGAMPLFRICPKCSGTGMKYHKWLPCAACSGSAYVRFAWTQAYEQHPILGVIARVLEELNTLRGTVTLEPERVTFRDPDTRRHYEIVVREIEHDEEKST